MTRQSVRYRIRIANSQGLHLGWRILGFLIIGAITVGPIVFGLFVMGELRKYAEDLPAVPDLTSMMETLPLSSSIVAQDGTSMAELPFRKDDIVGHRQRILPGECPALVKNAIIAAEDSRFFEHRGVDPYAMARAALDVIKTKRLTHGASTITQQVARNILTEIGREKTARRKVREAIMARRIEVANSKQAIFAAYINYIFLGNSSYGVKAAAWRYFSKLPKELSVGEAALLAGLAQSPSALNPLVNPIGAKRRRDVVLSRMFVAGFISQQDFSLAKSQEVVLASPKQTYGNVAPWYTEYVRRQVSQALPGEYKQGGLRIEAAVDLSASADIQELLTNKLKSLRTKDGDTPQGIALVWDHTTGHMKVAVGGSDWKRSQFDRIHQSCRQPGSAFKPVVFGAALETGAITPGTPLRDAPITVFDEKWDHYWKPNNSGVSFQGVALAHEALVRSLNAPAVDVLQRVGFGQVLQFAKKLGIHSDLANVMPLALGASCVSPLELASAYVVFASGGLRKHPVYVTRVKNRSKVIFDSESSGSETVLPTSTATRVMTKDSAFLLTRMLADVLRWGTGRRAKPGRPAAGKTGTTNDNGDAWFVGFTDRVVVAVWIGFDDPNKKLPSTKDGGRLAAPLWGQIVARVESGREQVAVPAAVPASMISIWVDRETGYRTKPGAQGAKKLYFQRGTEPEGGDTTQVESPDLFRQAREF